MKKIMDNLVDDFGLGLEIQKTDSSTFCFKIIDLNTDSVLCKVNGSGVFECLENMVVLLKEKL